MKIVKQPFNLIGKMHDYSWRGLLAHISAIISGAIYWDEADDVENGQYTRQWGFLDIALLTGPLELLFIKIHKHHYSRLFFHTIGLPILLTLQIIYSGLRFINEVISSTITYLLSYPVGVGSLFLKPASKLSYHYKTLSTEIDLDNTRTLITPHVNQIFKNPLEDIISLNVEGFRSASLLRATLTNRIAQNYHFLEAITRVPHSLVLKLLDLIDSNQVTSFLSLILFPIRLALTIVGSFLKAIDGIAHIAFELLAMPIVLLVHACTLPGYKTLKSELNTLQINNTVDFGDDKLQNNTTTFQKLISSSFYHKNKAFKEVLDTELLGKVTLVTEEDDDEEHHFLVGKDNTVRKFRIELTQANSPIVLKALHNNAFKWASSLHDANQLDETVEVLNDLIASQTG